MEDDLHKQRHLIENIDVQLANLLAKRMKVVDEIANIKNIMPNEIAKVLYDNGKKLYNIM